MKRRWLFLLCTPLILTGCLEKQTPNNNQAADTEEIASNEHHQQNIAAEIEENSSEDAANKVTMLYSYGNLTESPLDNDEPVIKNTTNVDEVGQYLAFNFSQFMKGSLNGNDFINNTFDYLHDDYKKLLGNTKKQQANTLQAVYDNYYSIIEEKNINAVYVSNSMASKVADGTNVIYRRHKLENGNEVFFEMLFQQNSEGNWLLIDDRPTKNPYRSTEKAKNNFTEEKGE